MTVTEYLSQYPVHHPASVADVRQAYRAAGGEPLSRSAFLVEVGNAGYRIERTRDKWMILPKPGMVAHSTSQGWVGPHLRP